jgi:hypothetical protein
VVWRDELFEIIIANPESALLRVLSKSRCASTARRKDDPAPPNRQSTGISTFKLRNA